MLVHRLEIKPFYASVMFLGSVTVWPEMGFPLSGFLLPQSYILFLCDTDAQQCITIVLIYRVCGKSVKHG